MFNLPVAPKNTDFTIARISKRLLGGEEALRQLSHLGFVKGAKISLVSEVNGNLIVKVRDSRVALGHKLASAIYVN
ncbi:MAG: FeoA family protein [Tissierellia bacterium]|nr:FeoA family protein [Tissierellia bacterium]